MADQLSFTPPTTEEEAGRLTNAQATEYALWDKADLEILRHIWKRSKSVTTRRSIALAPSLNGSLLLTVFSYYPDEVLSNPAVKLRAMFRTSASSDEPEDVRCFFNTVFDPNPRSVLDSSKFSRKTWYAGASILAINAPEEIVLFGIERLSTSGLSRLFRKSEEAKRKVKDAFNSTPIGMFSGEFLLKLKQLSVFSESEFDEILMRVKGDSEHQRYNKRFSGRRTLGAHVSRSYKKFEAQYVRTGEVNEQLINEIAVLALISHFYRRTGLGKVLKKGYQRDTGSFREVIAQAKFVSEVLKTMKTFSQFTSSRGMSLRDEIFDARGDAVRRLKDYEKIIMVKDSSISLEERAAIRKEIELVTKGLY